MSTYTIDRTTQYQTMKGWQASGDTGVMDYIASHVNWTDAALDACVAMGVNAVRIGLHSGIAENSVDYFQIYLDTDTDGWNGSSSTAEWQDVKDNWRIPVNDNADPFSINASGFKWAMVDQQIDNIVVPMKQKLAARGETLYWTITYIHFSGSNQLHVSDPDEYGELILATWQHLESAYGFYPDALEIFLEPDNLGGNPGNVIGSELAPMIVAARDRLVGAGYTKPHFIAPNTSAGGNAIGWYNAIKSADAAAAGYIDVIGYHRYSNIDDTNLGTLRAVADADGKEMAMNEFGSADFLELHSDLKIGRNTLWEQYALAFPTGDDGYQYFTVGAGPSYTITQANQAKYLQHYFKYVRRAAVMIDCDDADGVAFENANGTQVVIIKTSGSEDIIIAGLTAGTYGIRYTTGNGTSAPSAYDQTIADQTISGGQNVSFTMPAAGVVTVYDIDFMGDPNDTNGDGIVTKRYRWDNGLTLY